MMKLKPQKTKQESQVNAFDNFTFFFKQFMYADLLLPNTGSVKIAESLEELEIFNDSRTLFHPEATRAFPSDKMK